MKYILMVIVFILCIGRGYSFNNIAYVEVNNDALSNISCYLLSSTAVTMKSRPFFSTAVIFAANINAFDPKNPNNCTPTGSSPTPNDACIWLNPQTAKVLSLTNEEDDTPKQVKKLKDNGIKVLAALLPNHQNAGWSCINPTDTEKIENFSTLIADFVKKYNLDGIAIDDEYATCTPHPESIKTILLSLKKKVEFNNKDIQMVLLPEQQLSTQLSAQLSSATPGWYPLAIPNINNLKRNQLYPSVSTVLNSNMEEVNEFVIKTKDYPGIMVFTVTDKSQPYLDQIAKAQYGEGYSVTVKPDCIIPSPWTKTDSL